MITNIERRVNIINEAYKLGYVFSKKELEEYNAEAVEILKNAELEAMEGSTKEALVANLLEINDNGLEEELYVLQIIQYQFRMQNRDIIKKMYLVYCLHKCI